MRKTWVEPQILVEQFVANEHVAACTKWGVDCSVNDANAVEKKLGVYNQGVRHATDHCGTATNQVIYFTTTTTDGGNPNYTATSMVEVGTDGLGNLPCSLYTDGTYKTQANIGNVKPNDYIYWTTSSGNRTWHHQGYVTNGGGGSYLS